MAALLLSLSTAWLYAADKKKKSKKPDAAVTQVDERRRAVHALNRLTFGPRPGDVERVMATGVDNWIDEQLTPRKIEDRQLEARLLPFRTLRMDPREMLENFPSPQVVKAVADGKMSMPRDPEKRAVYEAAVARYERRKLQKNPTPDDTATNAAPAEDSVQAMADVAEQEERRAARARARENADRLQAMSPDNRMDAILKMSSDDRTALLRGLDPQKRLMLVQGLDPKQKETLAALVSPQSVIVGELRQAKVLRAAYGERQLEEVLTDFWFNHFNVFIDKGPDRYLVTAYERDVIRPHALGKFKDLLMATAKSPAMLFYLDNWQSVGPDSEAGNGANPHKPVFRPRVMNSGIHVGRWPVMVPIPPRNDQTRKRPARGLNENYAREIMELHTLGVNGGYTQQDVTELAKVLTGWTVRQPRRGGGYEFNPKMHEPGKKTVLGRHFKDEGEKEGEKAIEMLARHPATAQFISRKLAVRFVSDNPPEPLVKRMAETFRKTDGDIRAVLRTLFSSPEFWAPEAYRAKVKTPLEFVVSAVRATGADALSTNELVQNLNRMGMPLYAAQPPTGYSMKAENWVNSAALLERMNFALALGGGRLRAISFDPAQVLFPGEAVPADSTAALARLESSLLGGEVSPQTDETIRKRLDDPQVSGRATNGAPRPVNLGVLTGLILGSPEFQHR